MNIRKRVTVLAAYSWGIMLKERAEVLKLAAQEMDFNVVLGKDISDDGYVDVSCTSTRDSSLLWKRYREMLVERGIE